jgi:hypothetical protein
MPARAGTSLAQVPTNSLRRLRIERSATHTYLLLLLETPAEALPLSADEMAAIVHRYGAWAADLAARGFLVAGEKLADDGGRRLRRHGDRVLATDGPCAEAHDVMGGFFTLRAASHAEADALAARARACERMGQCDEVVPCLRQAAGCAQHAGNARRLRRRALALQLA